MKVVLQRGLAAVAVLVCTSAWSANSLQDASSLTAQVVQARQANAALMHQYNWNSRTEIISDSQVKDTKIELVSYGPNGQLQRSVLNDQPASGFYLPTPIGFLRRAVADDKKKELQQYLSGLQGLIEQYTLPTAGRVMDFMLGVTPVPDANGMVTLNGANVIQPGDTMSIVVNPWTRHMKQVQVSTTFQGDAVQLTATFETIPVSGLNHVNFAEVTVPSKQLSVQVQNYNYARLAQ